MNQPRVGRDGVAFFDMEDVAGYKLSRRDTLLRAIANDVGVGCRHLSQRRYRFLCARFLNVAHDRVEQHDREDGNRFIGQGRIALIQP